MSRPVPSWTPLVAAAMHRNGGFIRRPEALDLGASPLTIRHLVDSGAWVRIGRGLYADGALWAVLDDHRARPLLLARAVASRMERGWVLSHDSAAHALGMDILRPKQPWVHITRPGITNAWGKAGVKHHLARFHPSQVVEVDGLRVLDPARTAVDIGRERGFRHGLVAVDAALRVGADLAAMERAMGAMTCWPGITSARLAVGLGDAGAETVHETLGRELILEAGIGVPDTQFPIVVDGSVRFGDVRIGNHIFEMNSLVKLIALEEGGVAARPAPEILHEERKRERLLRACGLGVSSIYWEDYWGSMRPRAVERVRSEYGVTADRFGHTLDPELARRAAEIRARGRRRGA